MSYFQDRSILAPTNHGVHELNASLLDRFPGNAKVYLSADSIANDHDGDLARIWPSEILNNFSPGALPLHRTVLKVGCPIILLRNLDPSEGLCNGTRLIVTKLLDRVVEAKIITGDYANRKCLIPRISLDTNTSSRLPVTLRRRQLPIRLAFSMTINKAQGQSLGVVGVDLTHPVFSHGQLYVALSRAKDPSHIKVLLNESSESPNTTRNVVYKQILEQAKNSS